MSEETKITYTDSIKRIAKEAGVSTTVVAKVLKVFGNEVAEVLKVQRRFRFASFGSFQVKTLAARKARNPRTQEVFDAPERDKIYFNSGSGFNAVVLGYDDEVADGESPSGKGEKKKEVKPVAAKLAATKPVANKPEKKNIKPAGKKSTPAKDPDEDVDFDEDIDLDEDTNSEEDVDLDDYEV